VEILPVLYEIWWEDFLATDQIFLEAVGVERGPLSLVGRTEELLERKSSGCGLENCD
jgi:hypothetical protein